MENNRQIQAVNSAKIQHAIKPIWERLAQVMRKHRFLPLPGNIAVDRFPEELNGVRVALVSCQEWLAKNEQKTDNYCIQMARRSFIEARKIVESVVEAYPDIDELRAIYADMSQVWHERVKRKHG